MRGVLPGTAGLNPGQSHILLGQHRGTTLTPSTLAGSAELALNFGDPAGGVATARSLRGVAVLDLAYRVWVISTICEEYT